MHAYGYLIKNQKVCASCSDPLLNDVSCNKQDCQGYRAKKAKKNKSVIDPVLTIFNFTNELKLLLENNWEPLLEYKIALTSNMVSDICNSGHYNSKALSLNTVCLVLFFDGAQFNKGQNGTIYVLEAMVANLPPLIRSAFRNLIKVCVYY